MLWILLENFPPRAAASFTRHSAQCSTKSRSNWLQWQQSPKIPQHSTLPGNVKLITISFDSLMSLLCHTHGSTIPRLTVLLIDHKRFVWRFYSRGLEMGWYRAPGTSQTSGKRRKAGRSNQAAKVEKISASASQAARKKKAICSRLVQKLTSVVKCGNANCISDIPIMTIVLRA